MVKIGQKIKDTRKLGKDHKKTNYRAETEILAEYRCESTEYQNCTNKSKTGSRGIRGGKYENMNYKSLKNPQKDRKKSSHCKANRLNSLKNIDTESNSSPLVKKRTSNETMQESTACKSKTRRLHKKCKKGLRPTNKKPPKSKPKVHSLNVLLGNSNIKKTTQLSDLSTKYSKSELSRVSGNDMPNKFKRTQIDIMNKLENNLFENLKQGYAFSKPSKRKEVQQPVIIEHGNKVINFIKEVSQAQESNMELENEAAKYTPTESEIASDISYFKIQMEKLKEKILKAMTLADSMLIKQPKPSFVVENFILKIKDSLEDFDKHYINLIMTVHADLYRLIDQKDKILITGDSLCDFSDEEYLQNQLIKRRTLFEDKLNDYFGLHVNGTVEEFSESHDKSLLTEDNLFKRTTLWLKLEIPPASPAQSDKTIVSKPDELALPKTSLPLPKNEEKSANTNKKLVLDTKAKIADYVN